MRRWTLCWVFCWEYTLHGLDGWKACTSTSTIQPQAYTDWFRSFCRPHTVLPLHSLFRHLNVKVSSRVGLTEVQPFIWTVCFRYLHHLLHAPIQTVKQKWTTVGWKISTFPKRKLVLASVNHKGITMTWKSNFSKGGEREAKRDKKWNDDINYNRRRGFSGCWQRKIKFLKSFSFASQSFAPLALFSLYHCPSILLGLRVGAGGDGGLGWGWRVTGWACSDTVLCTFASSAGAYPVGQSWMAALVPDTCSTVAQKPHSHCRCSDDPHSFWKSLSIPSKSLVGLSWWPPLADT